jgi:p-aminobenzoyl-glutamate transporter AbgT
VNPHVPAEESNAYDAPRSELSAPDAGQERPTGLSWAFFGALMGPLLAFVLSFARVGPAGVLWRDGKGGHVALTPLGRTTRSAAMIVVAIAGALYGGVVLDGGARRGPASRLRRNSAAQLEG